MSGDNITLSQNNDSVTISGKNSGLEIDAVGYWGCSSIQVDCVSAKWKTAALEGTTLNVYPLINGKGINLYEDYSTGEKALKISSPLVAGDGINLYEDYSTGEKALKISSSLVAGDGINLYEDYSTGEKALKISSPLVAGDGINIYYGIGCLCSRAFKVGSMYREGAGIKFSRGENESTGETPIGDGEYAEYSLETINISTCLVAGAGLVVEPVQCSDGVTRIKISLA
jgi:hypothetical protein